MSDKKKKLIEPRAPSSLEQECIERLKSCCPISDIFQAGNDAGNEAKTVVPAYAKGLSAEDAVSEFRGRVYAATGANSHEVGLDLLIKASEAIATSGDSLEEIVCKLNIVAKTMQALEPRDEIEGQLLAQLAVLHQQSLFWLGRASRVERVNFANVYLNGASKLIARHHETLAALMKYRRGGEQRVYVEHVHVHDGGRAIVGNVDSRSGSNQKNEEGPHAKV